LKSQGKTVLYVSHRLEEIFEIADRVTVMRNGAVVGAYNTGEINRAELIRLMIGRTISETESALKPTVGESLLSVSNLRGGRVRGVSFTLRAGQILGLAGLAGAGRTDVVRMIFGVDPIRSGTLQLKGRTFRPKSPADAIRQGIVLVPEDRHSQGLVLSRSVVENITLPYLSTLATAGVFVDRNRERKASQEAGQAVLLKASSLEQKVSQLSGGNQQKVVFARWLIDHAQILLLDEPTIGVDVGARFEIYRLIRELAGRGAGVILVSSDLTELLSLADRLIVMREGEMIAELENVGVSQETILSYCYGERK
jgi:ABC-type sugar transport system ATPase subunit